jgi:hypothetical protein
MLDEFYRDVHAQDDTVVTNLAMFVRETILPSGKICTLIIKIVYLVFLPQTSSGMTPNGSIMTIPAHGCPTMSIGRFGYNRGDNTGVMERIREIRKIYVLIASSVDPFKNANRLSVRQT